MDLNQGFIPAFIHSYFIALGVLLGGALIGGIGAFIAGEAPLTEIFKFAGKLKIWALVAAIGGTFDTFTSFENGIFEGQTKDIFKQLLLIISAMGGSQTGWMIILWFTQEHVS
ncbi:YtrH family sporulation protein [Cytobacillus sp. S13-E01]|uniref:YtrH family sporulation protein n=1 Tax=Cytobacillus sp. S13-E01 TaxID=3031326 RepID=UPI0023D83D64|nr:YtrH family sporulation protein [Cytobacillus sp. S13-E01]MDF0727516.1 YtrH family sporulation protein [Cytobacillus sp. S13-E01]